MPARLGWCVALLCLFVDCRAEAQSATRGATLFGPCASCHGQQGEGSFAVRAPRLAGLPAWYVAGQLRNFRTGRRGASEGDTYGAQMARMAEQLWDDGEVAAVAEHVGALPPLPNEATLRGSKAGRGEAAFAPCAACHGANAEGNAELGAPPLRTLDDWYLVEQLKAFRAGLRGTHAEDKLGAGMRAAASLLTDDRALGDLAAYLVTPEPAGRRARAN